MMMMKLILIMIFIMLKYKVNLHNSVHVHHVLSVSVEHCILQLFHFYYDSTSEKCIESLDNCTGKELNSFTSLTLFNDSHYCCNGAYKMKWNLSECECIESIEDGKSDPSFSSLLYCNQS